VDDFVHRRKNEGGNSRPDLVQDQQLCNRHSLRLFKNTG
jgi:hypothetical protein